MHASHERRYFEGVMGKENGELFGIKNLLRNRFVFSYSNS
jgi:hypothetical protein